MNQQVVIGVLSDTHIPHRLKALPPEVFDYLSGCELILHAGDLEDVHMLDQLRKIAPVHAVRGNIHWQASMGEHDQDLPLHVTVPVHNHLIYMTHGHISFIRTMIDKVVHLGTQPSLAEINQVIISRLRQVKPPDADIVIFGHTHKACAEWVDGTLYFNPGAVCPTTRLAVSSSLGRLVLTSDGGVQSEWHRLSWRVE